MFLDFHTQRKNNEAISLELILTSKCLVKHDKNYFWVAFNIIHNDTIGEYLMCLNFCGFKFSQIDDFSRISKQVICTNLTVVTYRKQVEDTCTNSELTEIR